MVKTSPGAAQLIGRVLDSYGKDEGVLGTLAGDDTVFVTPIRQMTAAQLADKITHIFKEAIVEIASSLFYATKRDCCAFESSITHA